jgi:SAM-dependent methyltransferase
VSLLQLDASELVDRQELERHVRMVYGDVAEDPLTARHFETGRPLAARLGYPDELLEATPYRALHSFAGVGYHLDLAELQPGDSVLDLGSGSGTDVFAASVGVGRRGWVVGVDFTDGQLGVATALAQQHGITNVRFVKASVDRLPFGDASFDVVISNGVVNLSPVKHLVFAEAARVLKPGGRLAISDLASTTPLRETTRRDTELWASCIAGAIPATDYVDALVAAGFEITGRRVNDYRFLTRRALDAARTYGVESLSIAARRQGETP